MKPMILFIVMLYITICQGQSELSDELATLVSDNLKGSVEDRVSKEVLSNEFRQINLKQRVTRSIRNSTLAQPPTN